MEIFYNGVVTLFITSVLGVSTLAGPLQDLVSQVQGLADVRRDSGIGQGSVSTVKYIEVTRLQSKQNTAQYVCFETTFVSIS